jgi:polyhydroxybutyrate depolymerase
MLFKFTISKLLFLTALGSLAILMVSEAEGERRDILHQSLIWQDRDRSYWVHLPPKAKMNSPLPVLFHLHGGGGSGKGTVRLTYGRFNELADRDGFIVIYPDAIAKNWNDGRTEHVKPENIGVDDVGFIAAIIDRLKMEYPIDASRIFTTGMSNGGFMSTRLLCDRADLFRGGAILTATISDGYYQECNPSQPVGVLLMNGTDDPIVPFDGGEIRLFGRSRGSILSHDEFVNYWKEKNSCKEKLPSNSYTDDKPWDGTSVTIRNFQECQPRGALKVYAIDGGGHTWPGGRQYLGKRIIGNTSREIKACDEIWEFFRSLE